MIRKTTPQDLPALQDFLRPRTTTSMFLSATHHPKATTAWIAEEAGALQAVFGCTQRGFLNCEAPVFNPDWSAGLRRALTGCQVIGMSGEAGQIQALRHALRLEAALASFEDTQPHFHLDLANLVLPQGLTTLRSTTEGDAPLVVGWRLAYDREHMAMTTRQKCASNPGITQWT